MRSRRPAPRSPGHDAPPRAEIAGLKEERDRLRRAHDEGLGGHELVRALAAVTDDALAAIWEKAAGDDARVALVALGGYGRRELSPHSDVDLMVLHGGGRRVQTLAQRIFYALWDAGQQVGHATRTIRDCLRLAAANFEAETSFLEARLVCGDAALFDKFATETLRRTRRRGERFLDDVRSSMNERYQRDGHASFLLEPNLKSGAGGLRDLHAIGWLLRVFTESEDSAAAEAAGALAADDRRVLDDAADLLHRVRNHLHYLTGRRTDVLLVAHQDGTARALGYRGDIPVDALMRDVYRAARDVEHVAGALVVELAAAHSPSRPVDLGAGLALESGRVTVADPAPGTPRPELPVALYAEAARRRAPVSAASERWVRASLGAAEAVTWSDEIRRAFFDLLAAGDPGALAAFDQVGALSSYLPEWTKVRFRPQHNVYHRFTVDIHAFHTIAALTALADDREDPFAADVWRDVSDRGALLLAGLLHDVGKGDPGDHSVAGEHIARSVAARVGLDPSRTDLVAWLVRNHLLLADTATRRDTGDENLVVDVAAAVGDAERARMLYLLSVADGRATGPTAWTPWKATLVAELFTKVLHVLEQGDLTSRDAVELARLRTAELRQGLARYPEPSVAAHVEGMPRGWVLAFPTTELIRHFAMMAEDVGAADVRVYGRPTAEDGVHEAIVVARDRPGLFSKVAGAFALNGINIRSAQVFTRADGVALEVFRVEGAFDPDIPPERWEKLTEDARLALRGRISLDVRLSEKREPYRGRPARGKREAPRVVVDNVASDFYTVVEVHAQDHVGLLYTVTRALTELELDIHLAKVATYGEDVVDAFYVRDLEGQKVIDPDHLSEIERGISRALAAAQ